MSFLVLSGKMLFVFVETQYFFFGHEKMKDDLSQEIHGGTVFSAYVQALKMWCCALLPKTKSKMTFSRKSAAKDD